MSWHRNHTQLLSAILLIGNVLVCSDPKQSRGINQERFAYLIRQQKGDRFALLWSSLHFDLAHLLLPSAAV